MKWLFGNLKEFFKQLIIIFCSCLLTLIIAFGILPLFYADDFSYFLRRAYFSNLLVYSAIYGVVFIIPLTFALSVLSFLLTKIYSLKSKRKLFVVGPIILGAILLYFGVGFAYSQIYSTIFHDRADASMYEAQWQSTENQNQVSSDVCDIVKTRWKESLIDFQEVKNSLDALVNLWGLKFKRKYPERNGYITYYFRPSGDQISLNVAKENLDKKFKIHGIGSSFHWLDKKWHQNWLRENDSPDLINLMEIEGPFIRVRFETTYPMFDEFLAGKIYSRPPEHVLEIVRDADLIFIKTEALQQINYMYSKELGFKSFIVNFSLWNSMDEKNKIKQVKLDETQCLFGYGWFFRTFTIDLSF